MAPKPRAATAGAAQGRPASAGQPSQEESQDPPDIGPFVACVKRLAELGAQAGGSLRSLPADETDLRPVAPTPSRKALAVQLRKHASRDFWLAALAVHAYSIRDLRTRYEELSELGRQQHPSTSSLDDAALQCKMICVNLHVLLETCFNVDAAYGLPCADETSHLLALIRGDSLQVFAAILQTMTCTEAPARHLSTGTSVICALLAQINEIAAVSFTWVRDGDLASAAEWARAMASSSVLDHICRAAIHVQTCVATAQAAAAAASGGGHRQDAERDNQEGLEDLDQANADLAMVTRSIAVVVRAVFDSVAVASSSSSAHAGGGAAGGGRAGLPLPALREQLLTALGSVLRGKGLHFWVVKGLLDTGNAAVVISNRFTAALSEAARQSRAPGAAALVAQMPWPPGQQGAAVPERWMGLPQRQRMLTAGFERVDDDANLADTCRRIGSLFGPLMTRTKGVAAPMLRVIEAFYTFVGTARHLWQATGMKPVVSANQPAGAAGSSNSSSSGASSGTRVAVGGSGAAAAAGGKSAVVRRPFNVAHVCAAVGHGLEVITGTCLMVQDLPDSPFAYRAEVGRSVQLLCQLAMRLRGREAVRLLGTVWTCGALVQKLMAASMLAGCILTAAELEESVVPALEAMGDLLLHKYDKEKKLKFKGRPSGCGMSLDCALHSRAIFQLRASLRETLAPPSSRAASGGMPGRVRVALTDCFLRRSCALPALLTYGHPEELGGLLVMLRQAMFVSDAPAGGPGPGGSRAPSAPAGGGVQEQMVWLLVQLLEQVAAVCFHAPPPPRPAWKKGPKGGAAAAAAEDGSAAARLTDSAKRDMPAESLQQLWAAAQPGNGAADAAAVARENATRLPVFAVLQLLPAVIHSGRVAELSEANKDFTVGLSRVFLAGAVHGLSAMQRATHDTRAASNARAVRNDARRRADELIAMTEANSWSMLLVDQAGMYQWLARALGVSTAKRWPEGHAAALDVLEVLTVTVPEEEFVLWVQLRTGKDAVAAPTGAPASPSVPVIQLGEGWLQQQGRHNLAAALKAKGCHKSAAAGSGGAGGGSTTNPATAAAAVYQLLDDVRWKQHLADLPPLVCPIDAMRGMDVTYNFRPCSFPGCTRVPACQIPGAAPGGEPVTMRCGRCRVESYCGAECQRAHWREGHKVECPRLAKMRTDLEAVAVMMTFGGLGM